MEVVFKPEAPVFIDIQCYFDNNGDWLPMELAVIDNDFNISHHKFYIPPEVYRNFTSDTVKKNDYVYYNLHGIPYDFGKIHIDKFSEVLKEAVGHSINEPIYSKGIEKCQFLSKYLDVTVQNIEQFGETKLPPIFMNECSLHYNTKACATERAYFYRRLYWFCYFPL
jgi:hypothetical protein